MSAFSNTNSSPMDRSVYEEIIEPLLVEDPLPAINWMKRKNLLRNELKCSQCYVFMNWTKRSSIQDKYVWKCQVKDCIKYKHHESIRKDSFFNKSKLSLQKWIELIFYWCMDVNVSQAVQLLNVSKVTVIDMYCFFRDICIKDLEENPIKLGGPGHTVQIEEFCFSHKPKHQTGNENRLWVFGIVETSTSPSVGYMEVVDSRKPEALLPIITRVVQRGTTVFSEKWEAYKSAFSGGEDALNFVDSKASSHSQTVESYWNKCKLRIKRMNGCRRDFLNSYLCEMMWKERIRRNIFRRFCETIANQYPFDDGA